MKDLFLIPVWKRPQIVRICLQNLLDQGQDNILAIASLPEDIALCESMGVHTIVHENKPLGKKWNAGLKAAIDKPWDNVITLGSDDLVKPALFEVYKYYENVPALMLDKIIFVNSQTGGAELLRNSRVGAGRRIKRSVIESMDYKIWTDDLSKTLDRDSVTNMHLKGHASTTVHPNPCLVGLKSDVNIWPWGIWRQFTKRMVLSEALKDLPDTTIKAVQDLINANISLALQSKNSKP